MNVDFQPVMAALFAHLQGAASIAFTANAAAGMSVLTAPSTLTGLFPGLPVFGAGVARGAVIQALDPVGLTITLSEPMTAGGAAVPFTTGFLTAGRRVKHWGQVSDQPALFLRRTGVIDEYDPDGFFAITTLECEAWIYCNAGQDADAVPDDALASLEQLVRQSFAPDGAYADARFTLGGLVYWCRIHGKSDISPGDQGPQAIARIPIRITLP